MEIFYMDRGSLADVIRQLKTILEPYLTIVCKQVLGFLETNAIKGQALAYFLADHPIPDDWELSGELPDEDAIVIEVQPPWKMYFDGAAHHGGAGVGTGVVFITSQGKVLPYSFTLTQLCSNNVAEYQALILGLEMAVEMKQLQLQVVPPPNEAEGEENELKHLVVVSEVEKEEWRQPIIDYLSYGILLENPRRRTEIRRRAPRFLYRSSFEGVFLLYLGEEETVQALQEAHYGAEVVALKEVNKENVASFIRVNINYRFGLPLYIITDNGKPFDNRLMNKICDLFGFKQCNFSMYNAATNGLAEAFNKTLCNLLKKVVSKSKRDWHDRMEEALWEYRTTHCTPTQAALYAIVYGVEAVLPLERQIFSLRLVIQERITNEENVRLRLVELEALDEKSSTATPSSSARRSSFILRSSLTPQLVQSLVCVQDWFRYEGTPINVEEDLKFLEQIELGSTMTRGPKVRSPIWEHFVLIKVNEEARNAK
ncbi:uncharacterized protein [Nicotiana tomentosiformis]|uniref:uncharacterized protein n=1 Tax=Nicotiana tomentosiformis TaxID=4098 RepID=UPI00388CD692